MFIPLLFCLSQAKKQICICNGQCPSQDSTIFFNASSDSNFSDFLFSNIKDEKEIELNFYSQYNDFTFKIDTSYFGDRKVTLKTIYDSKDIFLDIKERSKQNSKIIKIKHDYKIVLPDLTPIPETNKQSIQKLLQVNAPSSSNIPISVGLHQLEHSGNAQCESGPTDDDNRGKNIQLSTLGRGTTRSCRCPITNFDQSSAYKCGFRCWGTASYSYRFKGVQVALLGTKVNALGKFYVQIDDEPEEEVNEKISSGRQDYIIIYTSNILEYKEHSIRIYSKGDTYELYKLVYWPSLSAKRLNCTSFVTNGGEWFTETDGIGGVRTYRNSGGQAIVKLSCTRFWIYGIMDTNYPTITVNFNGKEDQNSTLTYDGKRRENILVYESPEFEYSPITVNLRSSGVLIIYCIYYEEPPSPSTTPIPISIGFSGLNYQNKEDCGTNLVSTGANAEEPYDNWGCTKDLDQPSAYNCGVRCWGSQMRVSYTFEGVKFGIFGSYHPNYGKFNINLDGVDIATVNANAPSLQYAILYESDV